MAYSFEYKGFQETIAVVQQLDQGMGRLADTGFEKWAKASVEALKAKAYPPPKPTYERTYQLKGGYYYEHVSEGEFGIGNKMPYAPLVVVRDRQAWMHKGYWWTMDDVLEERIPELADDVFEAIHSVWIGAATFQRWMGK